MKSNWRPLPGGGLKDDHRYIIQFHFELTGYTIFLSDASRIWTESLSYGEVVHRARDEDCSITPSDDDPKQLMILFGKLEDVFYARGGATLTLDDSDLKQQIVMRTTTPLPRPLPALTWYFNLGIGPAEAMRKELVVPLLLMSFAQTQRIEELSSELHEKDNAISRILDKFESKNIELKSIFPTVPIARTSKKDISRADLAEHVKGLRPFNESKWLEVMSTAEEVEYDDLVLGAFRTVSSIKIQVQGFGDRNDDEEKKRKLLRTQSTADAFQKQPTPRKPKAPRQNSPLSRTPPSPESEDTTDNSDDLDAPPKSKTLGRIGASRVAYPAKTPEPGSADATPSPPTRRVRSTRKPPAQSSKPPPSTYEISQSASPTPSPTPRKPTRAAAHVSPSPLSTNLFVPPSPPPSTPASSTHPTPRKKLGKIGGPKDSAPWPPFTSQKTQSPTPLSPDSNRASSRTSSLNPLTPRKKLGKIGGRATASQATQSQSQLQTTVPETPSRGRLQGEALAGVIEEEDDMKESVTPQVNIKPEPFVSPEKPKQERETSQERADRKREELKRELEEKGRAGVKKRRRF